MILFEMMMIVMQHLRMGFSGPERALCAPARGEGPVGKGGARAAAVAAVNKLISDNRGVTTSAATATATHRLRIK